MIFNGSLFLPLFNQTLLVSAVYEASQGTISTATGDAGLQSRTGERVSDRSKRESGGDDDRQFITTSRDTHISPLLHSLLLFAQPGHLQRHNDAGAGPVLPGPVPQHLRRVYSLFSTNARPDVLALSLQVPRLSRHRLHHSEEEGRTAELSSRLPPCLDRGDMGPSAARKLGKSMNVKQ